MSDTQNAPVPRLLGTSPIEFFSRHFGLEEPVLIQGLGTALARKADYADLYFEFRAVEAMSLEDGAVKSASRHVTHGVGARVIAGEKTGYAYSDDVSIESLQLTARTARAIAQEGGAAPTLAVHVPPLTHDLYPVAHPPIEIEAERKARLLEEIDTEARRFDPRIRNVIASIAVEHKLVLIFTAEGRLVGDVQPLVRLQVTCIAEEQGNRQQGSYGGGGRVGFEFLLEDQRYLRFTRKAAEQAVRNLSAAEAPAGEMTVVLGPGWPGILLHEAIGHGLEGDFNRKQVSAFSGLLGQQVASPLCTVVDDGTLPFRRGSLNVDDEGTPTGRTVVIEKGILCSYLQDRLNARLMRMPLTGNGRRESFAHIPLPRMTNTFLLPGEDDPDEIIHSVDRGLYAVYFGGGQVDITSGKFVFSASEAYLIEGGKITRPVRGATLIGHGPEVLKRISRVGHDLQLDEGIGTCGKEGQSVPVGVGLPTVRIDGLTVGGTRV